MKINEYAFKNKYYTSNPVIHIIINKMYVPETKNKVLTWYSYDIDENNEVL